MSFWDYRLTQGNWIRLFWAVSLGSLIVGMGLYARDDGFRDFPNEPTSKKPLHPQPIPDTVFLEELTWTEVRAAVQAGTTTIILPTGGTEQNGPHMVLGKHNFIMKYTAEQISRRIGNTIVAPVMAYVPEGQIEPPTGHMRFPGTITLPNEYFIKVVEYAARSFKASGFKDIILIGDSGGNQDGLKTVAELLNLEWADTDVRVHFISDYYGGNGFREWLESQGETPGNRGKHAGISDTSQLMALHPELIRVDKLAADGKLDINGVSGNPTRARVVYGRKGLELKIEAAVAQIKRLMAEAPHPEKIYLNAPSQ
ncbi:MAG: creatininase family protein [Nitrospirae bacterium]|nr:creatininase family protein [Nitrospirota bacterium]